MKASINYEGVLKITSENEQEQIDLTKFMMEGYERGFYHLSMCQTPNYTIGSVAVAVESVAVKKKKKKKKKK